MNITRFLAWTALVAGLATAAPMPAAAQVGRFVKKKMKEKVEQTVGVADTASAKAAAVEAAPASGPVFNETVLEITPELLDRLEKGLAAEAATRDENARRIGKVLPEDEYERCTQALMLGPEAQKLSEETQRLLGEAKTDQQMQQAMVEMGKRYEAFTEPKCGVEPNKAEKLRSELPRPDTAAEEAAGLNQWQYSILKERILPLCTVAGIADADGVRIPTEDVKIFYVYSPGEVEALRPRCDTLVKALQAEG